MAMRMTLLKDAAPSGAAGASLFPRSSRAPYSFATSDGFTGTVDVEVSVTSMSVADASVTDWRVVASIAPEDQVSFHDPIYRVRGNTTGLLTGTASLYMLEEVSDRLEK